jgi:hypothetical protein
MMIITTIPITITIICTATPGLIRRSGMAMVFWRGTVHDRVKWTWSPIVEGPDRLAYINREPPGEIPGASFIQQAHFTNRHRARGK